MSEETVSGKGLNAREDIAARFVEARLQAAALSAYPGATPVTLVEAYATQSAAIARWPDAIGGWKVGLVQPQYRQQSGAERIAGPIFTRQIYQAGAGVVDLPMIVGGFGAVEAEFLIEVAREPALDKTQWTADEAAAHAGSAYIGVEFAGSPFIGINDFGPMVTASDFGNNAGLIVGPAIPDWRARSLESLNAKTSVDGAVVGAASAAAIPGGPLAAFAFILGHCASRGIRLQPGCLISTGAVTGVHVVQPGQTAIADFAELGAIACRIVAAAPQVRQKVPA